LILKVEIKSKDGKSKTNRIQRVKNTTMNESPDCTKQFLRISLDGRTQFIVDKHKTNLDMKSMDILLEEK
jgi:hypothetical protein